MKKLRQNSARIQVIMKLVLVLVTVILTSSRNAAARKFHHTREDYFEYSSLSCRSHSASIADFGGVGDGKTSNTKAFRAAIDHLSKFQSQGGSILYVPSGKWLTGNFNLTSHFTLHLHKDAVLLASQILENGLAFSVVVVSGGHNSQKTQNGADNFSVISYDTDESEWPVIDPLPSYGRGRDTQGGRYASLIFGTNLTDVVITGDNGTIDGQGTPWWVKFRAGELKYTRPYLIELMFSDNIQISNLTLIDSPSWNVHPVYCSNVIVQGITILAPVTSPNTDGINPDSCTNTRIEDCYIVSGDDCIAVKSGWDEYGIAFGMPTKQLVIRRLTCISPFSATIALGSEMSGGIEDVRAEDILAIDTESGVRIKTAVGRGAYVKDVYVKGMTMQTMKYVFWMTGNYGSHPDKNYDPHALPVIQNINYRDMVAENVTIAAKLEGIPGDPFTGICISNVTINLAKNAKKVPWNCEDIAGISSDVTPQPCKLLPEQGQKSISECKFPVENLPIDNVAIQKCPYKREVV